jgi:hypothetical protein
MQDRVHFCIEERVPTILMTTIAYSLKHYRVLHQKRDFDFFTNQLLLF